MYGLLPIRMRITFPDLRNVLEQGYPVHRLLLAKALSEDSSCQKLAELAKKQGTSVSYVDTGDTLHLKEMTLQCLYPDADETAADCNGLSQVWELRSHAFFDAVYRRSWGRTGKTIIKATTSASGHSIESGAPWFPFLQL